MLRSLFLAAALLIAGAWPASAQPAASYFAPNPAQEIQAGGARMIPIKTPYGDYRVWTKKIGSNPRIKVLLLHGGPGGTHEYFEAVDSFFPGHSIEYFYYDQLGSHYSDQPDDPRLWTIPRFVDEVEQVRIALGLDSSNFYLMGNSWGGILAMEYALKYQKNLKALLICNMMASAPAYGDYAQNVLAKGVEPKALAEIRALEAAGRTNEPRFEELVFANYYVDHVLRRPLAQWPEPVTRSFAHLNKKIYVMMQGPSEFGISGTLEKWDRTRDLHLITVPTLVTVARYDTMDPTHMRWMAKEIPHARALELPEGSHLAIYDDQQRFFAGVISFIADVNEGRFPASPEK